MESTHVILTSDWFQVADLLLDSVPVIVDHLDIDRVLQRCHRYR